MDTTAAPIGSPPDATGSMDIVRTIILTQGAILVASTIESAIFAGAFGPNAMFGVVLTAVAAVLTLGTSAALGRGSRRARRWTLIAEGAVLAGGILDLALMVLMTGSFLGPVPALTRLVAPLVVIVLVRRVGRAGRVGRVGQGGLAVEVAA
jgi:CHASE2 domain-containing sensor protein